MLNTIAATMRTEELLKQTQALAEELQSQQEELTKTNKRLEQQAATLQASEELLKSQQEQLQQTNAELQEKAQLLAEQKTEVEPRTAKWSRPSRRWKKRPSSSRSPPSTRANSWRTCRTNCARRSTTC